MLAANVCSADFIEQSGRVGLFRVHDKPSLEKQDILRNYLKAMGVGVALSENPATSEFQAIANATKDRSAHAQHFQRVVVVLRNVAEVAIGRRNQGNGLRQRARGHARAAVLPGNGDAPQAALAELLHLLPGQQAVAVARQRAGGDEGGKTAGRLQRLGLAADDVGGPGWRPCGSGLAARRGGQGLQLLGRCLCHGGQFHWWRRGRAPLSR